MSPVRFILRRPVTVVVLVMAACLGGWLALLRMPRDVFPALGIPTIYVAQPYGGMDPSQMEGSIAYYYEYHFLYITGIEHVESRNIQGASVMKLQFHPGTDMAAALAETVAYVNRARAFMPPGTPGAFVTRFDAGSVPVGQLVFSSRNPARTVGQMQDAALNLVRPLFATLPGVSAPPPFGGSARTITVTVKPDRLRSLGLSPDDVVQAVSRANVISPSGNIQSGDLAPIVPLNAQVRDIRDLSGVVLRSARSGAVFLRDVATVSDASDLVTSHALVNGRRTVYMPVTKRADASTLDVVDRVRASLPRFRAAVPDDIEVGYEFDQSPVVLRAMGDLAREGGIGALLTGLVVLLFLRDWRTACVVVINIPAALLSASLGLWITGHSIHLMTLGGLAMAVGILVDEATVAVEAIHARRSRGMDTARAAMAAMHETGVPRFLSMACVVSVFVPAFLMEGAAKALFAPLAMAVGLSMASSYLLSSTLVPVLCVWLLRGASPGEDPAWWMGIQRSYRAILARTLARPAWTLALYLAACASLLAFAAPRMGTEIFPAVEPGQFALRLRAPAGTRLDVTEQLSLRALGIIQREAGPTNVLLTLGLVGVHAPNYPVNLIHLWNGGPDEAHFTVQLRPGAIAVPLLKERLRESLARELPGVSLSFEPADIVSRVMSFGAATPVEVAVSGPSLAASRAHAEAIQEALSRMRGLRDVQRVQSMDQPTVEVSVDRERAGLLGVDASDVARSLVAATASSRFTVPNFWADPASGVSYSVQVQFPGTEVLGMEDLRNVPVRGGGDRSVLLRQVARVEPGTATGQIERYNMARVVSVSANLHGRDLGSVLRDIRAIPEVGDSSRWPARTRVDVRGQAVPLGDLARGLRAGLGFALVLVLLTLVAWFQRLGVSIAVFSPIPAALAGVAATLAATGTTLNVQSAIGAIMATGVAMANAILMATVANDSRRSGASAHASALSAATGRLRPIVMTGAAMVAGMLPLAWGLGEGGPQTAPLGRAVAGGLLAATLATLLVLPSVLALVLRPSPRALSLDPDDLAKDAQPLLPRP